MNCKKKVILKRIFHRGENRIGIWFDYDKEHINIVKGIGAKWSKTRNCWYVINNSQNLKNIFKAFRGKAWVDKKQLFSKEKELKETSPLSSHAGRKTYQKPVPKEYVELLKRRRYSPSTVSTYSSLFREFINYFPEKGLQQLTEKDIQAFQNYLVSERKVSTSTQNQAINAIKFYYEKVLKREKKTYYIDRPIKEKQLPRVMSLKQVKDLLSAPDNIKHRAMLTLAYSAGLRSGELTSLKINDINSERMLIYIKGGKGKKDRYTILSKNALNLLRQYFKAWKPRKYLFEGAKGWNV